MASSGQDGPLAEEEGARPADRPTSDPARSRGAACNLGCYQARLTLSGVALRRAIIAARALPRAHGRAGISDLEVSTTDLINRLCFFISALLSACCRAMWALHHFMCKVVCAMPLFSSFNAAPVGRKGCFLNFGVTRCATIHVRLPTTEGRALWLRKSRVLPRMGGNRGALAGLFTNAGVITRISKPEFCQISMRRRSTAGFGPLLEADSKAAQS